VAKQLATLKSGRDFPRKCWIKLSTSFSKGS
jgi:hypothetical protein